MRRIIFVDDDRDLLDAMRDVLECSKLATCVVAGSLDELKRQRQQALACTMALIDINLGDGAPSGVDVFHWLRYGGFTSEVVFLTGHAADHPLVVEASRIGPCRILSKPIEIDELERLVRETGIKDR
jgi:DNA-binding NtrC family response regulator